MKTGSHQSTLCLVLITRYYHTNMLKYSKIVNMPNISMLALAYSSLLCLVQPYRATSMTVNFYSML